MSSPTSSVRHRGPSKEKPKANGKVDGKADQAHELLDQVVRSSDSAIYQQWDYKAALAIITILAFVTRFWGISHPDEVVFDEVHFGKVAFSCPALIAH